MFDVVILGGGPAGSATAYGLACRGFRVALLDKSVFPRDKACGDILPGSALRALKNMGLSDLFAEYSANETWQLSICNDDAIIERVIEVRTEQGDHRWATIPRRDLDAAILGKAQQAGAVVYENATAHGLEVTDRIRISCQGINGGAVEARLGVIATGSIGRFSNQVSDLPMGIAVRGYYEGPPNQPVRIRGVPELLPGGYEWQFPISRTLYNIGVGTARSAATHGKLRLDKQLEQSPLVKDKEIVGRYRGGYLNYCFAFRHTPAHANHVLKVGDAAGLVEPHLGEGIRSALHSAEIAVECAAQALEQNRLSGNDLAFYSHQLRETLGSSLLRAHLVFNLMKHPRLWCALGQAAIEGYLLLRSRESRSGANERSRDLAHYGQPDNRQK